MKPMKKYKFCPICKSCLVLRKKEGNLRLTCKTCGWTHYDNPLPSIAAFVRNENGDILLIKRGVAPGKGKWALPTGFMEQHEDPEQAVVRELKEETNINGAVKNLIGVYTEMTRVYGNIVLIGYNLKYTSGKLKPGSDTTDARFVPVKNLPQIIFKSHRALIKDALEKYPATLIEVLKSKITEARITHTQLFYKGSMGIDARIMMAANLIPGEKVQVLNYNNGERLETYVIKEKAGSGKMVLYGPASLKGKVGDKLCILSYTLVNSNHAENLKASIVILNERNRIKRRPT